MNAPNKAPTGGITSPVNGQRYEGGQFTPYHGLYCGKIGAKRRNRAEAASRRGRLWELGSTTMFELFTGGSGGTWDVLGIIVADDEQSADTFARTLTTKSIDLRKV